MNIHSIRIGCVSLLLTTMAIGINAADSQPIKVIIDADPAIGVRFKDVDDGLMLLVALNSPEIELLGITTTYGNASQETSFRKTHELLKLADRGDIPVFRGAERGDTADTPTEASNFIVEMARRYPDEVTLLAVGPMTNVAAAIRTDPATADRLYKIVSMGGNVNAANVATTQCWSDLNYGSDVEAAGVFLDTSADLTVISIQTSERFFISPERYRRMLAASQYGDYLRRNTRFWYIVQRRMFILWDLAALACVVHPEWFITNSVAIDYVTTMAGEPKLNPSRGYEPLAVVNIPYFQDDREPFWSWFYSRI